MSTGRLIGAFILAGAVAMGCAGTVATVPATTLTAIVQAPRAESTPDIRATVVAEITATAVAQPTSTAVPTIVPTAITPSTVMPAPIQTSLPVLTPAPATTSINPCETEQGQKYLIDALNLMPQLWREMAHFGELNQQADYNPFLWRDDGFKFKLDTNVDELRNHALLIRDLEPPSEFVEVHRSLLLIADSLDRATPLFAEGYNQLDSDLLQQAIDEMTLLEPLIKQADDWLWMHRDAC